jgi:hypothetical protein
VRKNEAIVVGGKYQLDGVLVTVLRVTATEVYYLNSKTEGEDSAVTWAFRRHAVAVEAGK